MKNIKKRIENWWKIAPPKTKRSTIVAVALLIAALVLFFSSLFSTPKKRVKKELPQIEIMSRRTKNQLAESASVRRLREKVTKLENDLNLAEKHIDEIKKNSLDTKKSVEAFQDQAKGLQTQLMQKIEKTKVQQKKENKPKKKQKKTEKKFPTFSSIWGRPAKNPEGVQQGGENWKKGPQQPQLRTKKKLVSEIKEGPAGPTKKTSKSISIRIPAGSFFRGILLNGVDAPVALSAKKSPYPVLIKVKTKAWLPNEYRYDIKGCYIVASAWGDMSSERSYFRTERFSCVRKSGGVIESQLDASVIDGQDGKLGVFGRLVSKQGQVIARSLVAGLASGFANALSPRQSIPTFNTNQNGGDLYTMPPLGSTFQYGLTNGIGTAANKLADFYLEMAKQVFPVIEIHAGTPVEVFLLRGLNLTVKNTGSKEFKSANTEN